MKEPPLSPEETSVVEGKNLCFFYNIIKYKI